jgi:hypothetical protein
LVHLALELRVQRLAPRLDLGPRHLPPADREQRRRVGDADRHTLFAQDRDAGLEQPDQVHGVAPVELEAA